MIHFSMLYVFKNISVAGNFPLLKKKGQPNLVAPMTDLMRMTWDRAIR